MDDQLPKVTTILTLSLLILCTSCSSDDKQQTVYHPQPDKYPYSQAEVPVTVLTKGQLMYNELEQIVPNRHFTDANYLRKIFSKQQARILTDIPFSDDFPVIPLSINKDRFLVLNPRFSNLYEFHIAEQEWKLIASQGRGPGQLFFASDITLKQDALYVTTGDSRISLFDCATYPCSFVRSISLPAIQPKALVVHDDRSFTVMGHQATQANSQDLPSETTKHSLFAIDSAGAATGEFGSLYDIDGKWMLAKPLAEGKIEAINHPEKSILQYFNLIPMIYEISDNELSKIYRFKDFKVTQLEFNNASQSLSVPFEDWSEITQIARVAEDKFVVKLRHSKDRKVVDQRAVWEVVYQFYLLDLAKGEGYYLGEVHRANENNWFTDTHLLRLYGDTLSVSVLTMK